MPILEVQGMSGSLDQEMVLTLGLKQAAASVKELGISSSQVTPFIHKVFQEKTNQVIVVKVVGLFKKPERTDEVRKMLVRKIYLAVWSFLKDYQFLSTEFVEVLIGDQLKADSGDYYGADPRTWTPDMIFDR